VEGVAVEDPARVAVQAEAVAPGVQESAVESVLASAMVVRLGMDMA
jgi:hypothetical protein